MSDETVRKSGPEWTAMLRVLYALTDHEMRAHEQEDGPHIIKVAADATDTLEEMNQRIAELEGAVDTDLHFREWKEMTKKDKVRHVQAKLVEAADNAANDKAAMDYTDVRLLFNNRPSAGHCYNLMEIVGEEMGFNYDDRDGQSNRVTVDLNRLNGPADFHSLNKAEEEEGA